MTQHFPDLHGSRPQQTQVVVRLVWLYSPWKTSCSHEIWHDEVEKILLLCAMACLSDSVVAVVVVVAVVLIVAVVFVLEWLLGQQQKCPNYPSYLQMCRR